MLSHLTKKNTLEIAHKHLIPARLDAFSSFGVELVIGRREGYRIWDLDGHELMDLHLNGGTFNLGHRNKELCDLLKEGLDYLDIGNHHFASPERAKLAKRLSELSPGELQYTVFASSGSEAVDIAIKSARQATGKRKIISLSSGYHGRTGLSGAAGNDEAAQFFNSAYPDEFITVPFNDLDAMATALASNDIAAVLIETIPATQGFLSPIDNYHLKVKQLCERHGALYVADEVQTGLGRSGCLWAIEKYNVEPDIMVIGKGLSGGIYPIAAAMLSAKVGQWLTESGWGHVSTFGGAELGCLVANRVLEICSDSSVMAIVDANQSYLREKLELLKAQYPLLSEIHQCGLVFGLKFDQDDGGIEMMRALYKHGVWAIFAGFDTSILQFKPGLLIDRAFCDELMTRFEKALQEL
ncbi:putative aminotransferase [Shewanella sediminis HAW-EB3]|uniref:Putative aminotransferase n=1 Tax=Shewanella sediminis (strain HAW-EB3) TaxID=425104 RepID=A8FVI3_SHESH|nr:aminotransferase class III-fold pyridoxal phosphate-dependent enzyme [Shewanella sediminis]ABV36856.1 putative aminotransferase [Shewanella sediminis HAW-EB3]